MKDAGGNVVELHCTYDPATKGGTTPDGRNPTVVPGGELKPRQVADDSEETPVDVDGRVSRLDPQVDLSPRPAWRRHDLERRRVDFRPRRSATCCITWL